MPFPTIAALRQAGIATHLPIYRPRPDEDKWRQLFPGYLFVNFDAAPIWQRIFSTHGVRKFFTDASGQPELVPPQMLYYAQLASENGGRLPDREPELPPKPFQKEEMVLILEGTMAGFKAFISLPGEERSKILVTLFGGRPFEMEMLNKDLKRV